MRAFIVAGLLVVAACGGDDDDNSVPDGVPDCADLYAEGAPTDAIVEQNDKPLDEGGCITDEGEWESPVLAFFDCEDGERTAYYNELGWGITGGPWHHYTDADMDGAPAPDADVC